MPLLHEGLLTALDRTAERAGIAQAPLNADELMETALTQARRSAFSECGFAGPLRRLVRGYEEEADLSVFGRISARFDILRALRNLLHFDEAEDADPSIMTRAIEKPLFITGLPRSGTTFLHTLLAQDARNIVPRCWQLIHPYPRGTDRKARARVARQLWLFRRLAPGLAGMHPIAADSPQECTDITAQVFQSLRFNTTHYLPSYQRWIDAHGHYDAFRFHRRFLQHLDAPDAGRHWVLKCPDHVFALDAIRRVYPDAQIVMLHRDPLSVIASVAKLTDLLRRPFARHVDRLEIGHEVAGRWAEGADRMVSMRTDPSNRLLHLHYDDLVSAPLETVRLIYAHGGRRLTSDAEAAIVQYVAMQPRGGYRRHRHSLSEFGLDAIALRARFASYTDAFCLTPKNQVLHRLEKSAA